MKSLFRLVILFCLVLSITKGKAATLTMSNKLVNIHNLSGDTIVQPGTGTASAFVEVYPLNGGTVFKDYNFTNVISLQILLNQYKGTEYCWNLFIIHSMSDSL